MQITRKRFIIHTIQVTRQFVEHKTSIKEAMLRKSFFLPPALCVGVANGNFVAMGTRKCANMYVCTYIESVGTYMKS